MSPAATSPHPAAIRVLGGADVYERIVGALREEGTGEEDVERYDEVLAAQDEGDLDRARRVAATIVRDELREGVLVGLSAGR